MIIAAALKHFEYQHWLAVASRYSRRKSESADLLHEAILDAIRANRTDFSQDTTQRWFAGVIRNKAAMSARTAVRRQKRERVVQAKAGREAISPSKSFVDALAPSARSVATLVAAGLSRAEIVSALKLSPTAFRQRLTTIRRSWQRLRDDQRDEDARFDTNLPDLGLIRRALLSHVKRVGGLGTTDPDGHLIVIAPNNSNARSHSPARRQQKSKQERK